MKKTLAIVGSHPRTRGKFDFDRTDCDIWLFNEAVRQAWAKRFDAVFQMHDPVIWRNPVNRNDPQHYDWLKSQTEAVVYMQDIYPDVPASKAYPLQGVLDMLGARSEDHFLTSSIAQAMALCAYLGIYERVEVYGVAMETSTEYQFQREGVSFWLGFLQARGMDVYFAEATFQAPLYGYEGEVAIDYSKFDERITELEPQIENLKGEYIALHLDALAKLKEFEKDSSATNEDMVYRSVAFLLQCGEKIGQLNGACAENRRYKARADTMTEANGNFIFSRQEFETGAAKMKDAHTQAQTVFISTGTTLAHIQRNAAQAARGGRKRAELFVLVRETFEQYLQAHAKIEIFKGAAQENFNYMTYLDQHIRAAGGVKSEVVLLEAMQNA